MVGREGKWGYGRRVSGGRVSGRRVVGREGNFGEGGRLSWGRV